MKSKILSFLLSGVFVLTCFAFSSTTLMAKKRIVFGGGPAGGTFQVVANGVQVYKPVKALKDYTIKAQSSAGSIENLRKVDRNRSQLGVVYSGHVYLGRNGMLKNDTNRYENVLAVAFLYGAPAQLVIRKGSGIKNPEDLLGKKVGVGNAGSGAFANCELFLITLASETGSNAMPWGITTRQPLLATNSSTPSGFLPPFRVVRSSWRHRPMTSV